MFLHVSNMPPLTCGFRAQTVPGHTTSSVRPRTEHHESHRHVCCEGNRTPPDPSADSCFWPVSDTRWGGPGQGIGPWPDTRRSGDDFRPGLRQLHWATPKWVASPVSF